MTDFDENKGFNDVSLDGLDFMGLAPVDVRAAHDVGSIEDVGGLEQGYVGFEGGPILKTAQAREP
ncbi:hypothetical protein GYH30_031132 [Glycine max]|nr:hypothetical protein GYH30_031132 [Glycine max]